MSEQEQSYFPGEEPISSDNLVFQIGEKEVDIARKKKAINQLYNYYSQVSKENSELYNEINDLKNQVNSFSTDQDKIPKLNDKIKELQQEIFELEHTKKSEVEEIKIQYQTQIDEFTKKLEKEREKNRKLRKQLED